MIQMCPTELMNQMFYNVLDYLSGCWNGQQNYFSSKFLIVQFVGHFSKFKQLMGEQKFMFWWSELTFLPKINIAEDDNKVLHVLVYDQRFCIYYMYIDISDVQFRFKKDGSWNPMISAHLRGQIHASIETYPYCFMAEEAVHIEFQKEASLQVQNAPYNELSWYLTNQFREVFFHY